MSLLQDIQDAAVDAAVPISTLLRKCAVLAARLDNDELRAWVAKELNRYEKAEDVPRLQGPGRTCNWASSRPIRVRIPEHHNSPDDPAEMGAQVR
jgi:hypothetical protein